MTQDFLKAKKELLLLHKWKEISPEFNLDYFINNNLDLNLKSLGFYLAKLTNNLSSNVFSILGEEVAEAYAMFIKSVSPATHLPEPPDNIPCINTTWPIENNYLDPSEAAFEELTYRVILKIIESLGTPSNIIQSISFIEDEDNMVFKLNPSFYNFNQLLILGKLILEWDGVYVIAQTKNNWSDNAMIPSCEWTLYSNNIRNLTNNIINNIGLELNPKTYQLGELDPLYKLNTFPLYIQDYTNNLSKEMGLHSNTIPERYNILIEGPPGYGKSAWAQSFSSEVLSPKGYLIMVIDYNTLQDIILPNYLDKICLIINDADTLALDREESIQGTTEQILAWLDGTRSSFIKPFFLDRRASIITIMTVNSVKRWDKAALRKGRIHNHFIFDKVNLSIT